MADAKDQKTREERLAAKLRENLRRRKTQARALDSSDKAALPKGDPKS
jgi:tRNA A37 threonylcarbamoyladenosine dehydratase